MSRLPEEARDDSHKSWDLAIEEMRRRVFDWRKIEEALRGFFTREGQNVYCSEGDWIADEDTVVNLTALAKHLADELTSP